MSYPTILDIAQRNGSDALTGIIDEATTATPEVRLGFARTISGIMYKTLVRTANPSVSFRDANEGTAAITGTQEQRNVETYILNPRFQVDKAIADSNEGGWEAFLADEASAVTAGAMKTLGAQFYYGTSNDSKGFPGLVDSIDSSMEVDAEGTGSTCSSVFAVKWGIKDLAWVFGENGNIDISDVRISDICTDADNAKYLTMYVQEIMARVGLQVSNKNAIGRIRDTNATKTLDDDMISDLLAKFPVGTVPDMILMNRRSLKQLQQSRTATNATGAPAPFPADAFGVPIVVTDSIKQTEAAE